MGNLNKLVNIHVSRIRQKHNSRQPIDRLPPELMGAILRTSLPRPSSRLQRVETLSSVSTHWYDVVNSTPELWSTISNAKEASPQRISKALIKSKSLPLYLHIHCGKMPSLVEAILGHTDRWLSVHLDVDSRAMSLLESISKHQAPILTTLRITVEFPNTLGSPDATILRHRILNQELDLFAGSAPRLQFLCLRGLSIRWDSFELHHLRLLALGRVRISPTQLIAIIYHNPQLVDISLAGTITDDISDTPTPYAAPMCLENVENVYIGPTTSADFCSILRHFSFPRCNSISFPLDGHQDSGALSSNSLGGLVHVARHSTLFSMTSGVLIWKIEGVHPSIKSSRLDIGEGERRHTITCTIPPSYRFASTWIGHAMEVILPSLPNTEVQVQINLQDYPASASGLADHALFNFFGTLPGGVKRLDIKTMMTPTTLIQDLGVPIQINGVTQWIFPNLEVLVIGDCIPGAGEQILRMVRSRYGVSTPTLVPLPDPLLRLEVSRPMAMHPFQICKIVGFDRFQMSV